VDPNGRPISYVLTGEPAAGLTPGTWSLVDETLLASTYNQRLLVTGAAYPTFYTSTPQAHVDLLRELSEGARDALLGVWARDTTSAFALVDQTSLSPPDGELILPKLFRRSTDYLKAVDKGFEGNLRDWILAVSTTPSRDENDGVVLDGAELHLADLIVQQNDTVVFQADLLDIVFVEK
jgi:hypothetical protein